MLVAYCSYKKQSDKGGRSKGEIMLEKIMLTTPNDDKTIVIIRSEVEKDFLESPEIDVDSVTRP